MSETRLASALIEVENLINVGKAHEAFAQLSKIMSSSNMNWNVYWLLAQVSKALGDVNTAELACKMVLKLNPEFWFARELPKHMRGYYSQYGQDEIIEQFFVEHAPVSRVFVEVGGFDGVHFSNVRRLQEVYGWTGVSIEPVAKNFEKLSKSYSGRPVTCVRCAAGDQEGIAELNVSSYPHLPDWGNDIAAFSESEANKWQQKCVDVWHKEQVPIKTLTAVLRKYNIGAIDLLSVSAKGHDFEVLKGLDFSVYQPQIIIARYNNNRDFILAFLLGKGYRLLQDNGQTLLMDFAENQYRTNLEWAVSAEEIVDKLTPHLLSLGTLELEKPIRRASVSPKDLLTCSRFDLVPKFIYAEHRELGLESSWGREIYEAHIRAFNECHEGDGSGKTGIDAFIATFNSILDSIKAGGFDSSCTLVPVDRCGVAIDGSHRVAACMFYDKQVETVNFDMQTNSYNYEFFQNRGLAPQYCDAIALKYCQLNPFSYMVTIFPAAVGKEDEIRLILEQNGEIFYARQVQLSRLGSINLVRQMYGGEPWVGNFANQFAGAQNKAAECFRNGGPVRLYVFTCNDFEKVVAVKQQIRDLFGISNHSVHINDTHEETIRLARILLIENSVHFLNNAQLITFPKFQAHLENYKKILREQRVDGECLCIDGSSVMAAYGIREARDLDYLHFGYDNLAFDYPPELIGSHNTEMDHHVTTRDDIIFNPQNHFYYDGVKFASLGIIRALKQKRGEIPKDIEDIALIDQFLITPPAFPHVSVPVSPRFTSQQSVAPKRQTKIVGLVPARNEKHLISQCLRALSLYTDAIVYLDDASTDETLRIVESLANECHIERIIRKAEWYRDEPGDRNAMLKAGREIGGTHFIVIDADEMLTSNLMASNSLRVEVLKLQSGDRLALNWIQLWRSVDQYRFDQSIWTWNYKDIIFCDDGVCSYSSDFIHTPRVPENLNGQTFRLEGYEAGLLHFQFVNWSNLLLKQAWYRCLERIREPEKPVSEINRRYAPSKDETGLGLEPAPVNWFDGYIFFDPTVFDYLDVWRKDQITDWFKLYGMEPFAGLDVWDVMSDGGVQLSAESWLTNELTVKPAPSNMIEINGVLGYLNEGDIAFLRRAVSRVKLGGTIVEIGSFLGLSALIIARELNLQDDISSKIYCVDSWQNTSTSYQYAEKGGFKQDFLKTFLDNISVSGLSSYIVPINDVSTVAASYFADQSIDLLFIDGDHSFDGCYNDLVAWIEKLSPNGILIGHDCTPTAGVRQAVTKFCGERGMSYVIHEPPVCHYMYEIDLKVSSDSNGDRQNSVVPFETSPIRNNLLLNVAFHRN